MKAMRRISLAGLLALMAACDDGDAGTARPDANGDSGDARADVPLDGSPEGRDAGVAEVASETTVEVAAEAGAQDASEVGNTDAPLPKGYLRVLRLGQTVHGGTTVEFEGTGKSSVSEDDGRCALPAVADGTYAVSFRNGHYDEHIPQLILKSGEAFVKDAAGMVQPLTVVEMPHALRIASGDRKGYGYAISPSGTKLVRIIQPLPVPKDGPVDNRFELMSADGRSATPVVMGNVGGGRFWGEDRFLVLRFPMGYAGGGTYSLKAGLNGAETTVIPRIALGTFPEIVLNDTKVLYFAPLSAEPLNLAKNLMLAGEDGRAVMLGTDVVSAPLLSPNGLYAAFATNGDSRAILLHLVDLRTGTTRFVGTVSSPFDKLLFTPDSQHVVWGSGITRTTRVDGTSPEVTLGAADRLVLSPDGALVALHQTLGAPITVVPVTGGQPRTITVDGVSSLSIDDGFSSDGRYYFFETINALKAASTAALDVQIVTTDRQASVVAYAPAKQTVFAAAQTMTGEPLLTRMPLDRSGPPEVLTRRLLDAGTSSSKRLMYFLSSTAAGAATTLTVIDLASGVSRGFGPATARPLFSPDDTFAAYVNGTEIRVGKVADGTSVLVGKGPAAFVESFSPDGSRVLFRTENNNLSAAASDGSVVTPLSRWADGGPGATGFIHWLGNRQVLFTIESYKPAPPFAAGMYLAPVP
jgi:hypothetical protein